MVNVKRSKVGIVVIHVVTLILACSGISCFCDRASNTMEPSPTTEKLKIQVSSAEELIEAIGPDRTVEIAPGEYILSDVHDRYMEFVRWDPTTAGKTVTIRNVENLDIVGAGEDGVRLIVRPYSVFVLNFENCKDVSLNNLVLGHAPEKGGCESGVVGAKRCSGLTLRKCDLFGSGTEGVTLEEVENLVFEDSIIRDCTYGIMTLKSCHGLRFINSQFIHNEEFWGVNMHDTRNVDFSTCVFANNEATETLFNIVSSSDVRVKGGEIRDNDVMGITNNPEAISLEDVNGI